MNHRRFALPISAAVIFTALAGCSRQEETVEQPSRPAVIQKVPQKQAGQNQDAPTTKELLAYYSGNLGEAKSKWHECLATGLEKVSEDEKPRCVAAGNAWHNQPYVPGHGKAK